MDYEPKYSDYDALKRLRKYCAYQERSQLEVRQKLRGWGFGEDDIGNITVQLIEEKFLSEERFAHALAGGKFRTKQWGVNKVRQSLQQKGISGRLLSEALAPLQGEDYTAALHQILSKKLVLLERAEPNLMLRRQKLIRFGLSKGYEMDLVLKESARLLGSDPED